MARRSIHTVILFILLLQRGFGAGSGAEEEKTARDSAANYGEADLKEMPNRGWGFGDWSVQASEKGKAEIFLQNEGGGGARFGLRTEPPELDPLISVSRKFLEPMRPGQTLEIKIWAEWGGGWGTSSKGVELVDEGGSRILGVTQGGSPDIFVGRHLAFCSAGQGPVLLRFRALPPDKIAFEGTGRDGEERFSRVFTVTRPPAGVRFFSTRIARDSPDKRQLRFGDMSISGEALGQWDFSSGREEGPWDAAISEPPEKIVFRGFSPWTFFLCAAGGGGVFAALRVMRLREKLPVAAGFGILCVLLVGPIWQTSYIPMGDSGAHFRQVELYSEWPGNSEHYEMRLRTPYLLGTVGGGTMAKMVGPENGYKLVLSLSLLSFPLGCLGLIIILRKDPALALGSFPFAWHFSHVWGFYGFMAAVPAGMGLLCAAAAWAERGGRIAGLAVALAGVVLVLGHAMAWGMFCALAVCIICRNGLTKKAALGACLAVVPGVVVLGTLEMEGSLGWHNLSLLALHDSGPLHQGISGAIWRIGEIFSLSIGRPTLPVYVALGAFLCGAVLLAGGRCAGRSALVPVGAVCGLFFLLPNYALDTWIVYQRAGFLLVPALYFATGRGGPSGGAGRRGVARAAWIGAAAGVAACLLLENGKFLGGFRQEISNLDAVAAKIRKGSNVLLYLESPDRNMFETYQENLPPAWTHIGGWLQGRTGASFFPDLIDHGSHFVMNRRKGVPDGVLRPASWADHSWCPGNLRPYDFFLFKGLPWHDYLGADRGQVALVARAGDWSLYKNLRRR